MSKNKPYAQNIEAFDYALPQERIALYPVSRRDESKLLVWNKGIISHTNFNNISKYLPNSAMLVLNNSKVIPARMLFRKDTGALIEIFLLEPLAPAVETATVMNSLSTCTWKCLIGNKKKWKTTEVLEKTLQPAGHEPAIVMRATRSPEDDSITFTWTGQQSFGEIIEWAGTTPLPPYLRREAEPEDRQRYQTVYSQIEGAVAAPTAGLHFTPEILTTLEKDGAKLEYVTLHVSAGTFKPVEVTDYTEHAMHTERIAFSIENLMAMHRHMGPIIAVGTTSLRILESLYWIGVKIDHGLKDPFHVDPDLPYAFPNGSNQLPSASGAIELLLRYMQENSLSTMHSTTGIYIYPGYDFKMCDGLITNFHMPRSTLLLLVSAFTDNDWRRIYREALDNDYRFLSYGDASFLYRA